MEKKIHWNDTKTVELFKNKLFQPIFKLSGLFLEFNIFLYFILENTSLSLRFLSNIAPNVPFFVNILGIFLLFMLLAYFAFKEGAKRNQERGRNFKDDEKSIFKQISIYSIKFQLIVFTVILILEPIFISPEQIQSNIQFLHQILVLIPYPYIPNQLLMFFLCILSPFIYTTLVLVLFSFYYDYDLWKKNYLFDRITIIDILSKEFKGKFYSNIVGESFRKEISIQEELQVQLTIRAYDREVTISKIIPRIVRFSLISSSISDFPKVLRPHSDLHVFFILKLKTLVMEN